MINIEIQYQQDFINSEKLRELASGICRMFSIADYEVNIQIVGDQAIHDANNQYLGHDYTTDAISFDLSDDDCKNFDIIVNAQMAQRQASERNHPPLAELALYITHAMLHNLGFDDLEQEKAEKMHKKEDEILSAFGYGIVYTDHS